jgi:hypothetical protein
VLHDPSGTLRTLKGLGANVVKLYVPWEALAPDPQSTTAPAGFRADDPGAYPQAAWAPYDAVVRTAQSMGIGIQVTVGPPGPQWADGPGEPAHGIPGVWEPSPSRFGAFVKAVGLRYDGHHGQPAVRMWSIWNEPNYGPDLAPQAIDHSTVEVSPRLYRGLLDAAWSALQATGHGQDTILIGEIAPRGITVGDNPGNFSGMVPLRFVRALYCVDASLKPLRGAAAAARGCPTTAAASHAFPGEHPALFRASGFAVHPYPQGQVPPNEPTPFEPDYADLPALPRLESLLDRAFAEYGASRRLPLYSTEFGYHTDPPEHTAKAVPLQTAALYLNWAEYISWRDPGVVSYDQYLLADSPRANALGGFATGLEFAGGAAKPTLTAFRMPLYLPVSRATGGQALEVWGCARPAYYARRATGRGQTVALELAGSAGGPYRVLRRIAVDPEGYFDIRVKFPHSGLVRLAWTAPNGSAIHSRVAQVTIG